MKCLWIAGGALAVASMCGFGAQDNRPGEVKMNPDMKKLQGIWSIVSLEMEGNAVAAAALSGARIVIQGNRFTSTGMGATYEGTMEVDTTRSPKTLDMKFTTGPETGNTNLAIYEVDQYAWRLCLNTRGTDRPTKFASEPGSGIVLEILKRDSRATGQPAEKAAQTWNLENIRFEPAPELTGQWSMVSGILDGQPLDKNFVNSGRRLVEGSEMTPALGCARAWGGSTNRSRSRPGCSLGGT